MKSIIILLAPIICLLISCSENSTYDGSKTYRIEAKHSGKNLTLSYNRPLQTISDTAGSEFTWLVKQFPDSSVQIISLPSNQAIELAEVKDQVLPYITQSDSSNLRQRFKLVKNDDGTVYLQSVYSNYCIDVSESDKADYAIITTWPKEPNPNQKWKLQEVGGTYTLTSMLNGKYLAVTPGIDKVAANIGQWPFADRDEQSWIIRENDDSSYSIRNALSGMYLQESDGSSSSLYNVHLSPDSLDKSSQWYINKADSGYIKFVNVKSGLCIDVRDGVPFDGANVMTYDCNPTGDNQLWKVTAIDRK